MNIDYHHSPAKPRTNSTSSSASTGTSTHSSSNSNSSPNSPSPSISSLSSFQPSPPLHANLALIHPSHHSLASLSISSPTALQSHNSIISSSSAAAAAANNNNIASPTSPLGQLPAGHLLNRSIPPPLSLGSALSKSQSQDPSNPPSDDLMTARCSQFPIDSLEARHHPNTSSTTLTGSCRFQPYLPTSLSNNEPSNWTSEPKPLSSNGPRGLFLQTQLPPSGANFRSTLDDASHCSSELRSSCSSLASSTASSQSSGYFPPTGNLPFEETSSSGGGCGGPGGETLYPPLGGPGFSQAAAYPSYTGPSQRTSISGLGYPAAAFTPSGGSPPIASASTAYFHLDSAGAGRRHTVSSYASPIPIELNLVGHPEIDETLMKEEKRRRNKESSQRFRDRTRERLREKQERLEYLERRTKQLETQLRSPARSNSMQEGIGRDPSVGGGGRSEEREMIDRLQAENEALKSSLKTAAEEINRLQQLTGNQSPHSPLSIGQVYANTLAQLSPPASTDFASGSQASSPAGDGSYFGPTVAHGSSPSSDTAAPANNNGQQRIGQPNPAFTSPNDPRVHQLTGFNPHHHHPHHHHHQQQIPPSSASNEFWDNNNHHN
ncbi:hypothetical protein MJO29_006401 [Puccinia striiformis f. sp. tritici]|nr:hypothetical protein MJO29_006401 [Puccinia striiformis f. sp. tritici]